MLFRKITRARKIYLLSALAAAGLVVACLWWFRVQPQSDLRVGYSGFTPFVTDGPNGRVGGLAVDIMNEAARRENIKLTYVPAGADIEAALRSGKIDIYPLMALTPKRLAEFHASQIWWDNETALVSLEKAPLNAASATDGKRVAIRGLPALTAIAQRLFPRANLILIPQIQSMVTALCDGSVDAFFLDVGILQSEMLKGPRACVEQPLRLRPLAEGNLPLGTVARRQKAGPANRIFVQIAELALDGTVGSLASQYGITNSPRHGRIKEILDARLRSTLFRFGSCGLFLALLAGVIQTRRIQRARSLAQDTHLRFDAFMKHTPAITFINDEQGRVVYTNRDVEDADGLTHILSRRLRGMDRSVLATNRSAEVTETVQGSSGDTRHFLCLKFPLSGIKGPRFLGTVALDITDHRRTEEAHRFSQFSLDRSPDLVLWVDSDARIFYCNDAAARRLGYDRKKLLQKEFRDVDCGFGAVACDRNGGELRNRGLMTLESIYLTGAGDTFPVDLTLNYLELEGRGFVCCISRDITKRKIAERELSHQAQHDQLTGLPNRRLFETRVTQCIKAAEVSRSNFALFYFDLDGFKFINDTHGHSLGDALLQEAVGRLNLHKRDIDILARMGGDEFTLIALGVESVASAQIVGEKLLCALRDIFTVDGNELLITASLGVSFYPRDGEDSDTLLRHADAAMYEAKREGKNQMRFFTPAMNEAVRERLELESYLRRALERKEMVVHYQPEISLLTDQVVRNEALIRWMHPILGMIAPGRFIPIAEETGLIVPIGFWILEEACRYTKSRYDLGIRVGVGVNVSSVQISRPDFVDSVTGILHRTGLSPAFLELELTESVVMQGVEDVAEKIRQLRAIGVSVSIDDFGTGYSSLSYLQKLRIDNLKIDRSFIRDIPDDADALALTQALVSLAHSLGMKVVMEGIETGQQLEAVRAIGCDIAQGFLLGRPAPPVEIADYDLVKIA